MLLESPEVIRSLRYRDNTPTDKGIEMPIEPY